MKKITLIFAFAALISLQSQAQDTDKKGGFGLRGGASFFNFGGDDASSNDYSNRIGYHLGLYNSLFIGNSFAIEPGLFYSVKGTQNDDFANSRAILKYVDVPVLFRFYLSEGLNIFAGPQLSFLTSSKFEGDLFGSTISFDTESVSNSDFGVLVGLGYNLPKGLNLQASYNYGLSPVFKNSNVDVYNRGFQVSLGVTF
ncbi:porin family protein [Aquiflexum gelatinilyticum]|uniref:PorT family protein n=1 Tax=Aquiflexum gelatinilyticum TaxID=2961943 RepID=A0A9X2PD80_9BACT|nr:porin family protein [Aquiflexum gelatinilyticum]MCR9016585.1 PorT family protein [Aquiflexum gelatinilyticum]